MRIFTLLALVLTSVISCKGQEAAGGAKRDLEGKKVLMIIASRNFRDEEYKKPRKILEERGAAVEVASSTLNIATGMLGAKVKPDTLLKDIKAEDYDAIIFVGGSGSTEYWDDPVAHRIAKVAADSSKVLGAICLAPVTLANAGLLEGKKATVYRSAADKLRAKGAIYTGKDLEVVGRIVTANGPGAAEKFGKAIADLLSKQ